MSRFSARIGTRTGDRHTGEGTGNQDFACYAFLPGGRSIVAAVSDGAGSAAKAAEGSETAARAAVEKALSTALRQGEDLDLREIVRDGMRAAREALEERAQAEDSALEEYHTTLMVACLSESQAAVAHIGDGASIVRVGDEYKMLTIPARGMYPNETFFVTMDGYEEMVARNSTCGATEVILFTDGAQNELIDFQGKKPNAEAAGSAADTGGTPPEESDGFTLLNVGLDPDLAEWLESREGTHRDDATLLVMSRTEEPE